MVPPSLHEFVIGSLTAAASFIGLLFVALSVVLQKANFSKQLANQDRLLAQSSFTALVNIFFISLVSLEPSTNIGLVALVFSGIGLYSCWKLKLRSNNLQLLSLSVVYSLEAFFAIYTLGRGNQLINSSLFESIIIILFIVSLVRAWMLTGISQH